MRATYNINYYCRQSKARKGLAPIEVSIIINGKRCFIQLPRKESPEAFKKAMESKRNNPIKEYIEEVRNQFNQIQLDMMKNHISLSASTLREYWRSGGFKPYSISDMWEDFLAITNKKVGVTITKMSYDKYVSARNTMYEYVDKDAEVTTITPAVIENILVSLQAKYKEGTVCSIMTKIKTVTTFARDNGKLDINPFVNVKYGKGKPEIEFLTLEEIEIVKNKEITIDRLAKVRDIAIFQIASGLSYIDTMKLRKEDIHFTEDGTCFIYKKRQKTNVEYTAVVFPEGVEILKKYNYQLPNISNQKGNAYLKEIQTICGIDKSFHFHLFRKTYATRLINSGVRLETVSKALGHSSTAVTQAAYSKLLSNTVVEEIRATF